MIIRPARQDECGVLAAIHQSAFAKPWDALELAQLTAQSGALTLLALENGVEAGFILIRCAADEAEILTLGVAPEFQRRGVARNLINRAVAALEEAGCTRLFLEVASQNDAAIALYENSGFRESGLRKGYYADGDNALVMEKPI